MGCRCKEGRQQVRSAAKSAIRGDWRQAQGSLRTATAIARQDLPKSTGAALRGAMSRLGRRG
ncbi:MAG: hypothetical protein ABJP63_12700 [Hyphomicrobiales bacterium]